MNARKTITILLLSLIAQIGFSENQIKSTEAAEEISVERSSFSENEALESLLIIEGMGSVGSGFLTIINEKVFAVTNLHVLSDYGDPTNPSVSIKTVQNEKLKIERVFGANDHDIALIQFSDSELFGDRALEFKGSIQSLVKSGDEVKIPGNSKGRGVILWTPGEIKGVGATEIEHTAPTYSGNSGSPVIHVTTNSVIGVHTYATYDPIQNPFDEASRKNKDSAIKDDFRHFAYRLDTPKSWYQIELREFQEQSQQLQKWKVERGLAIGFIQSFRGFESGYNWWDENRLRGIATSFIEDIQEMSPGRKEFTGTDGVYDYYSIYQVVLPEERARLRRRVIGQLHNYIGLVDKENAIKKRKIYPFLQEDYEHEIAWSEWLTEYLHNSRDFLSE
jgi:hypothetical protein